jgi:hypothetical protein
LFGFAFCEVKWWTSSTATCLMLPSAKWTVACDASPYETYTGTAVSGVTCIEETSRPISAFSRVDLPRLMSPKMPTVNSVADRSPRTRSSSEAIRESDAAAPSTSRARRSWKRAHTSSTWPSAPSRAVRSTSKLSRNSATALPFPWPVGGPPPEGRRTRPEA